MVVAYATASCLVATVLVVGVVFGGQIKRQVFDEVVEVKFAPPPEAKPPPPPPPPPPAQKVKARSAGPPPPQGPKVDAPPSELPKAKPLEVDPSKAVEAVPFGQGDPNGCVGCTGKPGGGGGALVDAAPPPEPVRPYQISEVTTPPVAMTRPMPAYPEEARKQNVDMVVVVKFVVTENGDVEDIRVLRGHETLDPFVVAALRGWKFTPGTLDGKAVRVVRMMKFPFHLRTSH